MKKSLKFLIVILVLLVLAWLFRNDLVGLYCNLYYRLTGTDTNIMIPSLGFGAHCIVGGIH